MFLQLLFLASLSILFILALRKHTQNGAKPLFRPPGPKPLPIIGNLHQFQTSSTHIYFSQLSKIYGPLVFLQLGFVPTLVISSAKLAKEVLKTQDQNFCSRRPLVGQRKLSYNCLDIVFAPYNEYLREMRKICINHLFSSKRVQSFSSIRREEVSKMMHEICSLADNNKLVNSNELAMLLSSSIICRIGFGKSLNGNYNEKYKRRNSRFYDVFHQTQAMFMTLFYSDYFPCMGWVDKLRGVSRRLESVFKELDEFYQELIDEHMDPKRVKSDRDDIIDVLLQLQKDGDIKFELTLDHIKAVLMNIFIAGTETSSGTLVWTMTELMRNPNVMKKAQEEVRTLLKEQEGRTFVEEEDLQHLVYLKAIVKESFRMHPIVPLLVPYHTLQNCTLDEYKIEARTLVFVNVSAIGRDPKSWENPETFMPERFLGSSIDFRGQDFELIPFGAGRRICPGLLMGSIMIELTLANLLCWFDWELPDGMKREDIDMDTLPGISTPKKEALCLSAQNWLHPASNVAAA